MTRFASLGIIALAGILFVAEAVEAQDTLLASDNVILTVTNKSDLELSLGITLSPTPADLSSAPITKVAEFRIRQIVQPQQQATLQIPKGSFMVEASTAFSSPASLRRASPLSSTYAHNDSITTNEVWTFQLEKGSSGSLDPNDKVSRWKRDIQPARQSKPADGTGLRMIPERTHRLAPAASLPQPEPPRQIPTRALKLPEPPR